MTVSGEGTLIVGIDIGGTKTHLRAQGVGGPRELVLPTASWRRRDWAEDAAALLALAKDLTQAHPINAIGVGAHGCDDADECAGFEAAFNRQTSARVAVINDAELMPLAMGYPGQIGLVAGTGSIAVCRPEGKGMLVAGGWGWIIGDEGSAAGLVREAVRAVAVALDKGQGTDDPLCLLMFKALEVPSLARLGSALGSLGNAASVGALAHNVFEAAEQGSPLARKVIADGGEALARLVQLLDRQGANATHVIAGGSVIVAQPALWSAFTVALDRLCSGSITPHVFSGKPVEGACRLAERLIGANNERTVS